MKPSEIIRYYRKAEVREKIIKVAKDREIVPLLITGDFGMRPQAILFEGDYDELIREGVASLHMSIERWRNPMLLKSEMKRSELDELRLGWDLIIDIDAKAFEFSKLCAPLIIEALELHGLKDIFVKFSGRNGFHIAVPFETFPQRIGEKTVDRMFPEAARMIVGYLKQMIEKQLAEELQTNFSLEELCKLSNLKAEELVNEELGINPYKLVDIDPVAISSRHLVRCPYSLHEKTWLISIPLDKRKIPSFSKEEAHPLKASFEVDFLTRENCKLYSAKELFLQAFDWAARHEVEESVSRQIGEKFELPKQAIPEQFFPPCIKSILRGVSDGRKRSVFILINFLRLLGYDWGAVEKIIWEWNKRNVEPLRDSYINSQLNWHKKLREVYTPPNCDHENYYRNIGVCAPDELCKKIKNPLTYALRRYRKG